MKLLCNVFGHSFKDADRNMVTVQHFYGSSNNPLGPPEKVWNVKIICARCGYEHSRTDHLSASSQ